MQLQSEVDVWTARSGRDEEDLAFRDAWLKRLNKVMVAPTLVLGGWAAASSVSLPASLAVLVVYIAANIGLSHLAVSRHPLSRGAHLRAFTNFTILAAFAISVGPPPHAWLLGIPTIFGGLFTLSRPRARYVQGSAVVGVIVGQALAGVDPGTIVTSAVTLTFIAVMGEQLYVPLREAYRHAEEQTASAVRAQALTEEALESRKAFLATMSHEIRTPMNGVLGMAELLEHTELSAEQRSMVSAIRGCGDGLRDILNDILDLSKLEAGALVTEHRPYDPSAVLGEVVALMRQSGLSPAVALDWEAQTLPVQLVGDARRLRQVLTNLLSNAIKFTAEGSIEVRASWADDQLEVQIRDTGPGFDATALPRLFEPFEQGDADTTRQHGGTGLGLAISRRLARAMGGDLTADSTPGQGSTFVVTVRATEVETPTSAARRGSEPVALIGRVLLVDDNPVNLAVGRAMLASLGCEVEVATGGREAVDRADGFDAILMDCQMPEMDGFEATRALRDRGYARPVLAVTAGVTAEERQRCAQAGMDDVIAKPLSLDSLRLQLATHLDGRPQA